jgi:type II secretory pathway pseudopilin PulG
MRNGTRSASLGSILLRPVIHTCALAGALITALWLTQGTALADQASQEKDVERLANTLATDAGRSGIKPADCAKYLQALTDANAPDSITFHQREDIPELKAGEHPWTDARAACAVFVRAHAVWEFNRWAGMSKTEADKNRETQNQSFFKNCLDMYDAALKVGVPPTQPIDDLGSGMKGTMQGLRDAWCTGGMAKLNAANATAEAPYRKVLKNDKLRLWIRDTTYFELAGGGKLTPERLAATKVWFQHGTPEKVCSNGLAVHTLRRFQFDAQHKLVKETVHDYCGHPPDSAWH